MKLDIHKIFFIVFVLGFLLFFMVCFAYTYFPSSIIEGWVPRIKNGNNGTVTCNTYCSGGWENWTGGCLASLDNNNNINGDCSQGGKGPKCLCIDKGSSIGTFESAPPPPPPPGSPGII